MNSKILGSIQYKVKGALFNFLRKAIFLVTNLLAKIYILTDLRESSSNHGFAPHTSFGKEIFS